MMFIVPARTRNQSYDYHVRMDAVLDHLRNNGSYQELIRAGVPERDIQTANEIMDARGE